MSRDVHAADGLLITRAAAEDLVGVIDALALRSRPQVLSPRIASLRNQLIQNLTYENPFVRESAEVMELPDPLVFDTAGSIDTATASHRLNITEAGVRYLCRKGALAATRTSGGRWWIDCESVDDYRLQRQQRESTPYETNKGSPPPWPN